MRPLPAARTTMNRSPRISCTTAPRCWAQYVAGRASSKSSESSGAPSRTSRRPLRTSSPRRTGWRDREQRPPRLSRKAPGCLPPEASRPGPRMTMRGAHVPHAIFTVSGSSGWRLYRVDLLGMTPPPRRFTKRLSHVADRGLLPAVHDASRSAIRDSARRFIVSSRASHSAARSAIHCAVASRRSGRTT